MLKTTRSSFPACLRTNSFQNYSAEVETRAEYVGGTAVARDRVAEQRCSRAIAAKAPTLDSLLRALPRPAGGATPPRRSSSVGETATPVTERSWECLRLTPGRSLLLRLFVSSILHLSEDRERFLRIQRVSREYLLARAIRFLLAFPGTPCCVTLCDSGPGVVRLREPRHCCCYCYVFGPGKPRA